MTLYDKVTFSLCPPADLVSGQALQLSLSRREHVMFADKSLFVSCKGRDPVDMKWFGPSDRQIVERTGPVRVEPSRARDGLQGVDLLLNPVKRKDSGVYRCRARVNDRVEEASFELIVLQPIQFRPEQKVQYAAEGSDFILRCDVTGEPKPVVTWRGVAPLEMGPDKKYDIDQESRGLIIRDVSREDSGKYRCKATHVNKKESDLRETDIELVVQYKPQWVGPHQREVFGFLGGSANLSCRADAEPSAFFTWLRDGQQLEQQDHYQIISAEKDRSVLQVSGLDDSMFGNYTCEARNNFGSITHSIELRKGEKPAVPQVRVTKTESTRLTLSIGVPPEEKVADRYLAEYKTEDAAWTTASAVEFQSTGTHAINNLRPNTEYVIRVAAVNEAGRGDYSAGLRQKTAAAGAGGDPSAAGSQPVVLSLLVSLLMAALLVL
ncbi:fasciclin-2-like isoform X2 [Amphibalanus amphitrite]|uniref:fasciclin-2-like isoform X2 n=1 Tax=Amphibalanus amphitrite TaxID=1232801 RepID=UPI001C91BFAD|nr:fasciclin-2-like isoform X2 [Amphibalanus amphitrite]